MFDRFLVALKMAWLAVRKINMSKIRDVLRLKLEARLSHEQTGAALKILKGVVTKYGALANTARLNWAQIQALDDTALHNRICLFRIQRCIRCSHFAACNHASRTRSPLTACEWLWHVDCLQTGTASAFAGCDLNNGLPKAGRLHHSKR